LTASAAGAAGDAHDKEHRLVIPAYFHPALDPEPWASLAENAAQVRLVVLNLANGPGSRRDDAFLPPLARLRAAGVTVAGYVDTNYGRRPLRDPLAELDRYLEWYEVDGVFLDRAATSAEHVGRYAMLARCARTLGARLVGFNHGAHPIEAYAAHADLLGTFEGPWRAYVDVGVPRWVRVRPAAQFFHLVYGVPPARVRDVFALATRRNAQGVYATDLAGANPWERLPEFLLDHPAP
jgi:hypothetical protein